MRVLALDFDGVICQSRAEVLRVAVDAWNGIGLARSSHSVSSRNRKDGVQRGFLSNEPTSRTRQYVAGDELRKGPRGVPYLRLLLDFFGIRYLFADDLILDKETGISKKIHLRVLAEKLKVSLSEITFIDDKLNHVESVAELGVRAVVAGWGYNTSRELEKAKSAGFAVASLDDVEDLLFSQVAE